MPAFISSRRGTEHLMRAATEITGHPASHLYSSSRRASLVFVRCALWHLLRQRGWTLQAIGDAFNGRNHAAILHGLRKAERRLHRRNQRFINLLTLLHIKTTSFQP